MTIDLEKARFATRTIHVGREADPTTGAMIPPVYLSTTFAQSGPGQHKVWINSCVN
jgi:cystathionine beta-lyase/cystathionine gamma-synthase